MIEGHREEECWACNGYGNQSSLFGRVVCPWCRGTGVLFEGVHERGEACACHLGVDYRPGDDWFGLVGHEIDGVIRARLPRDRELADRIVAELERDE
jgi:hypothetical protein